jgi:SAM-dependent methyltransferase
VELLKLASVGFGESVLELGCGTGALTRKLVQVNSGVLATDISIGMLIQARRWFDKSHHECPRMLVADMKSLPFSSHSFDLIVANLTPLQESSIALMEIRRVLRPRGRIALSMWAGQYAELQLINKARIAVGETPVRSDGVQRALDRLINLGFSVRVKEHSLVARYDSRDACMDYRRSFGKPINWTTRHYSNFLNAFDGVLAEQYPEGPVELGWKVSYLTADVTEAGHRLS